MADDPMKRLLTAAKLLYANAEGCAVNHYADDFATHGLPGWLADCAADIQAAERALANPSPAGGVREAHWTIESLAQWLHDEIEHQDSYPGCQWPEHPDDDGNRDGGFVKIVPKHAQAYFRQMAARCFGVRPFSDAYFRALKGEPALSSPATPEPALAGWVRELDWRKYPEDGSLVREGRNEQRLYLERAFHPFGAYFLMEKNGRYSIKSSTEPFEDGPDFDTPELARADIDGKHKARILSSLSPASGSAPEPVSAPANGEVVAISKMFGRCQSGYGFNDDSDEDVDLNERVEAEISALSKPAPGHGEGGL